MSIVTHVGFSDESNWNRGRFRSIGLVTAPVAGYSEVEVALRKLMSELNISEFKWHKLSGFRERDVAIKMCKIAISAALEGKLRADVLIWDIEDERNKIVGRDDVMNFERMYFHLIRAVFRDRWPDESTWRLHPDQNSAIDWNNSERFLQRASQGVEIIDPSLLNARRGAFIREYFKLAEIEELKSAKTPFIQLADLFAGVAAFSWNEFSKYQVWLNSYEKQFSLIPSGYQLSSKFKTRCQFLYDFKNLCKANKFYVSLKKLKGEDSGGLCTHKFRKPLNFWIYRPQHSEDRAPTRHQR